MLTFEVLRFSDTDSAEESLPELVRRVVARFDADRNGADPFKPATMTPEPGDDAIVLTIRRTDRRHHRVTGVSLLLVRTGAYVHIATGVTLRGDRTPDVADMLTITTNRREGGKATPVNASEWRTAGLWDVLPGLDDVPSGFAMTERTVPEPFAPRPDATKGTN